MFYKHIEYIFRKKQGAELTIKAQQDGWIVATITTAEIAPLAQEYAQDLERVMRNMNNNIGRWLAG